MAADHVSAKFITDLQRTLEIDPGALAQAPIVVSLSASSQASTSNQRAVSPAAGSAVTVRQTPEQAIEAPISMWPDPRRFQCADARPGRAWLIAATRPMSVMMPVNMGLEPFKFIHMVRAEESWRTGLAESGWNAARCKWRVHRIALDVHLTGQQDQPVDQTLGQKRLRQPVHRPRQTRSTIRVRPDPRAIRATRSGHHGFHRQ
jgi:hypothetical protein